MRLSLPSAEERKRMSSILGLGELPLEFHAWGTHYTPSQDPTIWRNGHFTDDNVRQKVLREFSTAIGKELYAIQKKKHRGGGGLTEEEAIATVETELNDLNTRCRSRHPGPDCAFVKTINNYFCPKDNSYKPGSTSFWDTVKPGILNVGKNLLITDHQNAFTKNITPSSVCTATEAPKTVGTMAETTQEPTGPHSEDLEFGNRMVNAGSIVGRGAASVVAGVTSLVGSSRPTREW
jgi:hypothetical protein